MNEPQIQLYRQIHTHPFGAGNLDMAEVLWRGSVLEFPDHDSATKDGRAFGAAAARQAIAEMTSNAAGRDLNTVGVEAVAQVIGRAKTLIDAGISEAQFKAWLGAATDTFASEMAHAVTVISTEAQH